MAIHFMAVVLASGLIGFFIYMCVASSIGDRRRKEEERLTQQIRTQSMQRVQELDAKTAHYGELLVKLDSSSRKWKILLAATDRHKEERHVLLTGRWRP